MARGVLAPSFLEIFVDTPLEECRQRDTKSLYAAKVASAPGIGTDYEPAQATDFCVRVADGDIAAEIAERLDEMI